MAEKIKPFKSILDGTGLENPTILDLKELQRLMLCEMSNNWEWTYKRFMDLKANDRSNFDLYDN